MTRTGEIPSDHPHTTGEQVVIALVVAPIALALSLAALPIVVLYLVAKLIDGVLAMSRS